MEAEGFTYVKKDAMGDPDAQIALVEDAIAAGNVDALMIVALSVDASKDAVCTMHMRLLACGQYKLQRTG